VCHCIHLNPERAGLVAAGELEHYDASSFHQLWNPSKRWAILDVSKGLSWAGGLADTPLGRGSYRDYLAWLSVEDAEKRSLGYEQMCQGWVQGTKDFRKAVLGDLSDAVSRKVVEAEAEE
jgi:putative transposase